MENCLVSVAVATVYQNRQTNGSAGFDILRGMKIVTKVLLTALTLMLLTQYLPGIVVSSVTAAIVAACVLGILNVLVKPIVIALTLPVTIVTFGLFLFIINAAFFSLAALLVGGFSVEGFVPALLGSLIVSVVGIVAERLLYRSK